MDLHKYIHMSTEGHVNCFQILSIENKAALNFYIQVFFFFGNTFSFLLDKYLRVGLLGLIGSLCLILFF